MNNGQLDRPAGLLVLGSGPGGYTAAFRAADLGLDVVLVERWPQLGGVCLNVGCIPSKALLHAARVIEETAEMAEHGITFGPPTIDLDRLRGWKDRIVGQLTNGLEGLAGKRKVRVMRGTGRFVSPHELAVEHEGQTTRVSFDQCVIAAGSEPVALAGLPDDSRILDSTGALALETLPESMLVIGGGIIGLEMATVYDALGVKVSVVELTNTLIPAADRDMIRPLHKRLTARYEAIMLGTKVIDVSADATGLIVTFEGEQAPAEPQRFDRVLTAVGRRANGKRSARRTPASMSTIAGFIAVDKQMRTNVPHIFAIGDIVGEPMLAHKATHEGKVAAEVAAGQKRISMRALFHRLPTRIPRVAWVGLTEDEAKTDGIAYEKGVFPWAASGRSLALGRSEGITKLLFDRAAVDCSVRESSARMRATSSLRRRWRSRWVAMRRISV